MTSNLSSEAMAARDDHVLSRESCVIRYALDRHCEMQPDKIFVTFDDGTEWSYAELRQKVIVYAAGFQALGVHQGDIVLSWLPNGAHALLTMLGLNYMGAACMALNTAYRGGVLEHVIRLSGAMLMVTEGELVERLTSINGLPLEKIVVVGNQSAALLPDVELVPETFLSEIRDAFIPLEREIQPWDTHRIVLTSGTTGPSKAVLISYVQTYEQWSRHQPRKDARVLVNLPIFHNSGGGTICDVLMFGGSIALVRSFKTDEFWDTVRRFDINFCIVLGVMANFLLKAPSTSRDKDHSLRVVNMVPLVNESAQFSERFNVNVFTSFGMTEIALPIVSELNPTVKGTCGRPIPGVEMDIVDENDYEVPVGHSGEGILRTDIPWSMMNGYLNNHEATARAWRNGWFHTGDCFRKDEEGNLYVVDRLTDSLRRRGENISSQEVEKEILAFPEVREAAVIGVKSEFGEDEVMAVVAPIPNARIDCGKLIEFLRLRLAHFMLPKYVRILEELPKTPSLKVQKFVLRGEGVTSDTWDRDKAGISIKSDESR